MKYVVGTLASHYLSSCAMRTCPCQWKLAHFDFPADVDLLRQETLDRQLAEQIQSRVTEPLLFFALGSRFRLEVLTHLNRHLITLLLKGLSLFFGRWRRYQKSKSSFSVHWILDPSFDLSGLLP